VIRSEGVKWYCLVEGVRTKEGVKCKEAKGVRSEG